MECFELVTVVYNYPMVIQSLVTNESFLLISTKSGQLFSYSIDKNDKIANIDDPKWQIELIRSYKNFTKSDIKKMLAVPFIDSIICQVNDVLSLYSLDKLNKTGLIPSSKGLRIFSISYFDELKPYLCIVLKRKVIFYEWSNGEFMKNQLELNLNETPRAIIWLLYKLVCVGLRKDYYLIKPDAGKLAPLFSCGKKLKDPILVDYSTFNRMNSIFSANGHSLIGLQRDEITVNLIIDKKGSVVKQYVGSVWSDVPSSVVVSFPFIIATVNNTVEIASLPLKLFTDDDQLNCNISKHDILQRINLLNIGSQLYNVVPCQSLCRNSIIRNQDSMSMEDLPMNLKHDNNELFVFNEKSVYKLDPLPLVLQINRSLAKRFYPLTIQLIDLIPDEHKDFKTNKQKNVRNLYAFDLFCNGFYMESLHLMSELDADPIQVISLFPDMIPVSMINQFNVPDNLPKIDGGQRDKAVESLITYLTPKRKVKLTNYSDPTYGLKIMQIIDTTLLKCYLEVKEAMVFPLIRLKDNNILLEEIEPILLCKKKFNEVVLLYQSKNQHQKALEFIFNNLAEKDSVVKKNPFFTVKHLCEYLKALTNDHYDLIKQYLPIINSIDPSLVLNIVTDDSGEAELWPRHKIKGLLASIDPELVHSYLEHIVFNWSESNQYFIEELISNYFTRIIQPIRDFYFEQLKFGIKQYPKVGSEPEPIGSIRSRLILFLEVNNNYNCDKLLELLPLDILFEERAILLGKKSIHRSSLAIYIFVLGDHLLAESYSHKIFENFNLTSSQTSNSLVNETTIISDIYFQLIQLYMAEDSYQTISFLTPLFPTIKNDYSYRLNIACNLMNKYICNLNIDHLVQLIDSVPNSLSFQCLSNAISYCFNKKTSLFYSSKINRQLLLSNYVQVNGSRIHNEKASFCMYDSERCVKCFKKIGVTAFVRLLNGQFLHSYCSINS